MKRLLLLSAVLGITPSGLLSSGEAARVRRPVEFERWKFANLGVVTRRMKFSYRRQPCYYVEGIESWSTPWGPGGTSSYMYLYEVVPEKQPRKKRPPIVFDDFESGSYAKWTVEGTAFGKAPSKAGSIFHHQPLRGWKGRYLVDSFRNDGSASADARSSDSHRGKLTSVPFQIQRHAIRFLIGGGRHPGETCIRLLVDGKVVRTATGHGSEQLTANVWDVREFEGREGILEIIDDHSGSWGHIMVDEIVFDDELPPPVKPPPLGLRSAVPLGGLGAGTIELRSDGSLREWNIFNNSPAGGGPKVHLDQAFFGLRAKFANRAPRSWALRTHPAEGLPPIERIEYSGTFPVSRLRFSDPDLAIGLELYAYCEFHLRKPEASATPAVIFSFCLSNPLKEEAEVSLLFNLPNHIKGVWSSCGALYLLKGGRGPVSGNMAIRAAAKDGKVTYSASDDIHFIWKSFSERGLLYESVKPHSTGANGALSVRVPLKPNESRLVTFVLSWYFPHRPHGDCEVGNYYTRLYQDALDVAEKVIARLPQTWKAIISWHRLCFENSLPEWLKDALANSPSTMFKTGMWFADGRWLQWESFSCPAVDPIHIHFYRALPYELFFPSLSQNLLKQYAAAQSKDGYIREHLADRGSPNRPGGRMMGDSCTAFILRVFTNFKWTGDTDFLNEIWANVKKAALWQIKRSAKFGLPQYLNNTYDWWSFHRKTLVSYNAFLHLAALRAAGRLAAVQGDQDFAEACRRSFELGVKALEEKLWTGRYFRSWWSADRKYPDALHADTLYGQIWSFLLGLGPLIDTAKISSHLRSEKEINSSPFGLKVMQLTENDSRFREELVWQAGSLDWCTLSLYAGGNVEEALSEAGKTVNVWREHLRDFWDWRDLTTAWDGQPWCNSHYARQLIFWSIPLALSGQNYSAVGKKILFQPKVQAPAKLPWFTPTAEGVLELSKNGGGVFEVYGGSLELRELCIGKSAVSVNRRLAPGEKTEVGIPTR